MRTFIFIFLLIIFTASCAQPAGTKYFFKEVGWTITLPSGFKDMASEVNEGAKKAMEDTNFSKFNKRMPKALLLATKDTDRLANNPRNLQNCNNLFSSTIVTYDSATYGSFNPLRIQGLKYQIYGSAIVMAGMDSAKIDTASTIITIDGLSFDKFHVTLTKDGKSINNIIQLAKYYKGYIFSINYVYTDEKTKDQIESSLNNSSFTQ